MKLSHKTFFYSFILALVTVLLFSGYIIWLLPRLYVDHMEKQLVESAKTLHLDFIKNEKYDFSSPFNPENAVSFTIPLNEDRITLTGIGFQGIITIKDESLKTIFSSFRSWMADGANEDEMPDLDQQLESVLKNINSSLITVDLNTDESYFSKRYRSEGTNFESYDSKTIFISTNTSSNDVYYTNFIGITNFSDRLIITIVNALNPSIDQIRPVTLQSVPMIIAVLFLVVFLASGYYSRKIVQPIEQIARRTNELDFSHPPETFSGEVRGEDEIAQLSRSLDEIHLRLWQQYQALQQDHERQEVFLRASSHQLKTPLAGALGLLDGMIGKVGKFSDTEKYLPEVRNKLLIIQKMVEDLLNLTRKYEETAATKISLRMVTDAAVENHSVEIAARNMRVESVGDLELFTNPDHIQIIVENLISNAVKHSPNGAIISIQLKDSSLIIRNSGTVLPAVLKNHAFEPFVTGETETAGHGLGLYLVHVSAAAIGAKVNLSSDVKGVIAQVEFPLK